MRLPDASFDRVICDMDVMYFPDAPRGLAEMRRVLRASGRVAVSVNTVPETALVSRILPIMDRLSPPLTARSGPNSFDGSEQHMRRRLEAAGFRCGELNQSMAAAGYVVRCLIRRSRIGGGQFRSGISGLAGNCPKGCAGGDPPRWSAIRVDQSR